MKRNVLSARAVQAARTGWHADGGGLYLQVTPSGKSWVYRFKLNGRARYMGLGSFHDVSLAEARDKAAAARKLRAEGNDPIDARKAQRATESLAAARAMTFDQCADAYIRAHEAGWANAKHRQQWKNTLATYVAPVFGSVPVVDVDVSMVAKVVEPLWSTKTETASRVRGRIEAVLDWAKVRGFRTGENPARWRGHLDHLLPAKATVHQVEHHAALAYEEIGAFMRDLRAREGSAAAALEFLILTAARTAAVLEARWAEIDSKGRIWTVPADRMKGRRNQRREHRVPLSAAAMAVIDRMRQYGGELVFPGLKAGKPLSDMALLTLLGRMGRGDITAHGFRSTFRDWASEQTNFAPEVAEMALAHTIEDKVEAAYRRRDLLEKRRRLMEAWAKFCAIPLLD
jgi:integrase